MTETIIDPAAFAELKQMGDDDFITELIDTFLSEAPRMLADLHAALPQGNAELFRRSAHSLKSNSVTFGAQTLAAQARELEALGRENQLAGAEEKLARLDAEYEKVSAALKELRNG